MNKETIFRKLYKNEQRRIEWIDKVPSDIQSAFFDNDYVNSLHNSNDLLMEAVFQEHYDSVMWFLCDWKPGVTDEVGHVGCEPTKIENIDQYIEWMKIHEGFE